jgi:hypothetical protein
MSLTVSLRPPGRVPAETPAPPRPWLARVLAGDADLPPFDPAPLPPAARPAAEADAAARALGCPDLFVLDAPDRAARERVLADVARAAALRGERVLVLSPDPAAADRLAELAAADPAVKVVRALADDENPHRPNPAAARVTSAAAGRGRVDARRRAAETDLRAAETELAVADALAAIAADLKALADRFAAIEPERAALAARRDAPSVEVVSGSVLAADLARIVDEAVDARRPVRADRDAAAARRKEVEVALAAARQHKADAADPNKKTGFFSRLLHKPKPPADPAELDRQIAEAEREAKELADRETALQAELDAIQSREDAEVGKRVTAAAATVRDEAAAAYAALAAERDEVAGRFSVRGKELARGGVAAPAQLTPDAAARVTAEIEPRRAAATARRAAAREKLDELARTGADLIRSFLAEARVVVGTPGSLTVDPVFADPPAPPPFALLVLDHAEDVGEADFAQLAPLAGRWVLAGDPFAAEPPARSGPRRPGPLLARLARRLDCDPWARDGDRLLLRLAPDAAGPFTREAVLDHPDVELRFAADGVLAAIAFPPATPGADVVRFLADQLGEMRLRPCGPLHWHDAPDALTACWPPAEAGGGEWVVVEAGVRVRAVGAFAAAVSFDPSAGWDRPAAEAWLSARVPGPSRLAALRPDREV